MVGYRQTKNLIFLGLLNGKLFKIPESYKQLPNCYCKKSIEVTDVKTLDQAPFLEYRHESDQAFFLQMSFACIGTRGDPKAKTDGGKSG
jgi:hypothetical protein